MKKCHFSPICDEISVLNLLFELIDDFFWGGLFIKVIQVESTGHELPGVDKVEYYANHRFGMVSVVLKKENGSVVSADIYSAALNE